MNENERTMCLSRPLPDLERTLSVKVKSIMDSVRSQGDAAIRKFTQEFDNTELESLFVSQSELQKVRATLPPALTKAVQIAANNISRFHQAQFPKAIRVDISPGIVCQRIPRALDSVGLYVPGGRTPLVSTLLMLGIPAKLADCREIILCTPPRTDGTIDPLLLWTADFLGIQKIAKIGGAQAIAAMAFGTQTVPRVNRIFGPGNAWVTEAKLQVASGPWGVSIDLPAGPSELLVIADENAEPQFVAADLLSQAEHDSLSQVLLVSNSEQLINQVNNSLLAQLPLLPRRELAIRSLKNSKAILVNDIATGVEVSNLYAPEHLIVNTDNPQTWLPQIRNAGSVFLGQWTPESVGDYASGTNHVLPTYGFARSYSGLSLENFFKFITVQELNAEGLSQLASTVELLACAEGLQAHGQAVKIRRDFLRERPTL